MADVDLLPSRGVPYLALVDANGIAIGGTSTIALLASKGMKAICQVDPTGIASSDGTSTVALLASKGIRAFAAVDENGVSVDDAVTKADIIRMRGIRPMVAVDANGLSQTGPATIPVIAQRGLSYFCPVDETGTAGSLIPVPPNTIRARPGIFTLTGETMTPVVGYAMVAGFGAFALSGQSAILTPPVGVGNIWDNANKASGWVLSGTPLVVASQTATATPSIVRGTNSHATGKYYFEFTDTNLATITCCGIVNATFPLSGTFIGGNLDSLAYEPGGNVYINGGAIWTLSTYAANDVIGYAFDFTAKKLWIAKNGGAWNQDNVNHNPNTGLGGISISTLNAGPYFTAAFDSTAPSSITANFGQAGSAYIYTKPTGFLDW